MRALLSLLALFTCFVPVTTPADDTAGPHPVSFTKHVIASDFPTLSAAPIDVDGDGRLDVVAAGGPSGWHSPYAYRINWYRAPDWEAKPVCSLADTNAVILHIEEVDFTHQRKPADPLQAVEISVTEGFLGAIWWFRYDRQADSWSGSKIVDEIKFAHGTAAGDVDRDGYMDVLVPTQRRDPQHGMVWARNPGDAAAREQLWPTFPLVEDFLIAAAHYPRLADLNNDGRLDALLAASVGKGWFGYWLQGEDPQAYWEPHVLPCPGKKATNIAAADLNGDGLIDMVGTEGHGLGLWGFLAPDFQPVRIDDELKSTHSLTLGDFNGDGAVDIVSCGFGSAQVACFVNDGKGNFSRVIIDADQKAYEARTVDLDADGDPDILLSGQNSGNLVWYENTGRNRRPLQ